MTSWLRNVFLGLLLANILVMAWLRWIRPAPVADATVIIGLDEPELVPVGRPAADSDDGVAIDSATSRCIRVGPFADESVATSVSRQLEGRGIPVRRTSRAGNIWMGHWVQIVDLENEAEANRALQRLSEAGLSDAYIFETSPDYKISLGVFRNRDRADKVAAVAADADFRPVTVDRTRPGTEHWLVVELVGQATLSLSDLQLETTRILRTESVSCEAMVVGDGGVAGD